MTELSFSLDAKFIRASQKLIFVRLGWNMGGMEVLRKFRLADSKGAPTVNYMAFLSPDGQPLDGNLKPFADPQSEVDRVRATKEEAAGKYAEPKRNRELFYGQIDRLSKLYPEKSNAVAIPWQCTPAHAFYFAGWDRRRLVVVQTRGGQISPTLAGGLGDRELLLKHQGRYAFVKLESAEVPGELQEAARRVGPEGVLILDEPKEVRRGTPADWPAVLQAAPGPHTKASLMKLLDRHALDVLPRIYTELPKDVEEQRGIIREYEGKNERRR